MSDLQREAFELKISMEYEQPPCIERDGDGYADGYVDNAWWGWQACAEANKLEIAQIQSARQSAQEPVGMKIEESVYHSVGFDVYAQAIAKEKG